MPKRQQLRRLRRAAESSDSVGTSESSSDSDDTEGSLADFIEHDSAEADDDASYQESESSEAEVKVTSKRLRCISSSEEEEEAEETTTQTEDDPDEAIRRQYSADMEQRGSVVTEGGVRRSMRITKGKAPTRYVDEDYAELMLEDISPAEQALLAQEFTSSSGEEDGEFDDLGDEEDEDEDDAQVQRP